MAGNIKGGLTWLSANQRDPVFPDPSTALKEPNGLLAAGGRLDRRYLLAAYSQGIFPWFEEGQPILWWSPDPRAVIDCGQVHVSRSLRRCLRDDRVRISVDHSCAEVIAACAGPRRQGRGTWITDTMQKAYLALHESGHVHSVEVWRNHQLVGGLYGLTIGSVFCGESMFSAVRNASKIALAGLDLMLVAKSYQLIDCQMPTPHLQSMGARPVSRTGYLARLRELVHLSPVTELGPQAPRPIGELFA